MATSIELLWRSPRRGSGPQWCHRLWASAALSWSAGMMASSDGCEVLLDVGGRNREVCTASRNQANCRPTGSSGIVEDCKACCSAVPPPVQSCPAAAVLAGWRGASGRVRGGWGGVFGWRSARHERDGQQCWSGQPPSSGWAEILRGVVWSEESSGSDRLTPGGGRVQEMSLRWMKRVPAAAKASP